MRRQIISLLAAAVFLLTGAVPALAFGTTGSDYLNKSAVLSEPETDPNSPADADQLETGLIAAGKPESAASSIRSSEREEPVTPPPASPPASDNASIQVKGPAGRLHKDDRIHITVASGWSEGISGSIRTEGLDFLSVSNQSSGSNTVILLPGYGSPSCTYTYRVTAEAGESVSFEVYDVNAVDENDEIIAGTGQTWSSVVQAAEAEAPGDARPPVITKPDPAVDTVRVSGPEGPVYPGEVIQIQVDNQNQSLYQSYGFIHTEGLAYISNSSASGDAWKDNFTLKGYYPNNVTYTYIVKDHAERVLFEVYDVSFRTSYSSSFDPGYGDSWSAAVDGVPAPEAGEFTYDGQCITSYSGTAPIIKIPDGVTAIGADVFSGNTALKEIILPESLKEIGADAFADCEFLKVVVFPSAMTSIGRGAFRGTGIQMADLPNGITEISAHVFEGCYSLTSVSMPNSVKSFEVVGNNFNINYNYAFADCPNLEAVKLSSKLESIGGFAFSGCKELSEISLPDSLERIEWYAFTGCTRLKNVVLPASVKYLGSWAFARSGLTEITLQPKSIEYIGEAIFYGCHDLKKVAFPKALKTIESMEFFDCLSLQELNLPDTLESIGSYAFAGCESLTQIVIPDSVRTIRNNAFSGCSNATEIALPAGLTELGGRALTSSGPPRTIRFGGTRQAWDKLAEADIGVRPVDTVICAGEAAPSSTPSAVPSPSATAAPSPAASPSTKPQPSVRPAPVIPEVPGYESGRINGRNYYVKTAGASTMCYLRSSSGRMVRVSAPYTTAADGSRFYPVNYGGAALFPRLEDGSISCYCLFAEGLETPVLRAVSAPKPVYTDGYQTGRINGRDYYIKTSGASLMFYLKSRSGRMVRVSAPYVKAADGTRYYPVNHGGTVLFPKLSGEGLASYETGSGQTVLTVI